MKNKQTIKTNWGTRYIWQNEVYGFSSSKDFFHRSPLAYATAFGLSILGAGAAGLVGYGAGELAESIPQLNDIIVKGIELLSDIDIGDNLSDITKLCLGTYGLFSSGLDIDNENMELRGVKIGPIKANWNKY